jgi:hypothetical protein
MNIVVFGGGHSVAVDLLPPNPVCLDVGCRGLSYGHDMLQHRPSAVLHELDIDDIGWWEVYTRAGIAGYTGLTGCSLDEDLPSRHMVPDGNRPCYTIKDYSEMHGIKQWDALKLDCEGSEYPILMSFDRPWAKQISVEFHQHTKHRRTPEEIDSLMAHLSKWYDVFQHHLDSRYDCGLNYWDTLLIARPQFVITP